MKTLNQYIYEIFELYRSTVTDDVSLDERLIESWIIDQRALWLRNEFNKNRSIDDALVQDLGCVELEIADTSDCCNISSGCTVLRTNVDIPTTIERHNSPTITRVGPINKMNISYPLVTYNRSIYSGNGRFNQNLVYAYLLNNRIYLKGNSDDVFFTGLQYINIRGVFNDPRQVAEFNTCTGTSCYDENSPFPLNEWIWNYMKVEILKLASVKNQLPTDESNNDNDDINVQQARR